MKKFSILYLFLIALSVLSCKKDEKPVLSEPFSYNGNNYKTLEDAVNAVRTIKENDDPAVITLLSDVSGTGVSFGDATAIDVQLNLESNTYTLEDGGSIDVGIGSLCIFGNNGGISALSDAPIFKGCGGSLYLKGDVDLKGTNLIGASLDVDVEEDYQGKMKGDVTLENTSFRIFSTAFSAAIPLLTVAGEDSFLSVETDIASETTLVEIGKVESKLSYPVRSVKQGLVSCADGVHIHNFAEEYYEGSCINKSGKGFVCNECGFEMTDENYKGKIGKCNIAGLIHHDRVEPDEVLFGNVEYWECPDCGNCYSDNEGKNRITGNIYIYPKGYESMERMKAVSDSLSNEVNVAIASIFTAISVIVSATNTIIDIVKVPDGDWEDLNKQLNELMAKVDAVSKELNQVIRQVKMLNNKAIIVAREDNLVLLQELSKMTLANIQTARTKYKSDTAGLTAEITKILKDWNSYQIGGATDREPNLLTMSMINGFNKSYVGVTPQTYPQIYSDYVNSMCIWEHEGTTAKRAELLRDVLVMGVSYMFTNIYTHDLLNEPEATKKARIELQTQAFNEYMENAKQAEAAMTKNDSLYRVLFFNSTSGIKTIKYNRNIQGPHDFKKWIADHRDNKFPYNNKKNEAVNSCEKMMRETNVQFDKLMTTDVDRFIDQIYNRGLSGRPFLYLLRDDCGFNVGGNISMNSKVISKRTAGFSSGDGGRDLKYKIFYWRSNYTGSSDHFGVYGIGSDGYYIYENTIDRYYQVYYKCCIGRWGDNTGRFKELGRSTTTTFCSAVAIQ